MSIAAPSARAALPFLPSTFCQPSPRNCPPLPGAPGGLSSKASLSHVTAG